MVEEHVQLVDGTQVVSRKDSLDCSNSEMSDSLN